MEQGKVGKVVLLCYRARLLRLKDNTVRSSQDIPQGPQVSYYSINSIDRSLFSTFPDARIAI